MRRPPPPVLVLGERIKPLQLSVVVVVRLPVVDLVEGGGRLGDVVERLAVQREGERDVRAVREGHVRVGNLRRGLGGGDARRVLPVVPDGRRAAQRAARRLKLALHRAGGAKAAAAVAAATIGFAILVHIPNGRILIKGLLSMILAHGVGASVLAVGKTIKVEGAAPKVHCVAAPITVC